MSAPIGTPDSYNKLKRSICFVSTDQSAFQSPDSKKKLTKDLSSSSIRTTPGLSSSSSDGSLRLFSPIFLPASGIETPLTVDLEKLSISSTQGKNNNSKTKR